VANLVVDVSERIATLTLNRPEARNALDADLLRDLRAALDDADASPDVDVIVLAAADPVFCAGLDLRELSPGGRFDIGELTRAGNPFPPRSKPVVGAINGPAVTGGLELALSCDVLVASERATFGDTHARVGIMPWWGMTVRLPEAVGARTALAMSLTGNFLGAHDAHRLGMVHAVVPHEELGAAARRLALDIASNDQVVVRKLLAAYREGLATTGEQARRDEHARAMAHQGEGFDVSVFAARRKAVVERGRSQA